MVYSTACAISERSNVLCGRTKLVAAMSTLMVGVAPAQAQNDPQVAELPAVVVTATGYEQDVKDAPASISVITREELERQPYRELTDALAEVPGVSISTGEGNTRDISIRGMGPQYTLILVDGKRMSTRESRTSAGTVNNISETGMLPPLEAIERIEVIRGPMSSLYGSDALGGVVNIITRRIGKEWQGSVRVNGTAQLDGGFGSYGESSFYLSGPLIGERLGLQLTGSANRRAEDDIPGGSPERKDESLTAKLGWKVSDNHDLLFEVGRYNQKASNTVGKSAEATATTGSVMEMERTVYSATHFGSYGSGVTSESYIQHETGEEVREQKTIKNITAQSSFLVPLGQNNLLNVGAFYRLQDLTDLTGNRLSGSTSTGTERKNWALFAENEWSVTDSFALTAGLRMDHDELYGQEWLPRLYGVWRPTGALVVKGGIAYGFRAPDLRQTISDWGQSSRGGNIYGNPDLKAETSRTYELGVGYDTAGGVELGATIYYTEFKDKIDRLSCVQAGAWCASEPPNTFGSFPTTYTNLDKAKLHGLELSINAPLTRTLELKATGTLTHSEVQDGDRQGSLNDTPKQQASISLNWKPTERFSSYVRAVYRGEERVPVPALIGNSSSGDSAAPAYTTVDLGGTYKLTSNTTLSAGVQNLFNKKLDYDTVGYMIDGTRVWVGLAATF